MRVVLAGSKGDFHVLYEATARSRSKQHSHCVCVFRMAGQEIRGDRTWPGPRATARGQGVKKSGLLLLSSFFCLCLGCSSISLGQHYDRSGRVLVHVQISFNKRKQAGERALELFETRVCVLILVSPPWPALAPLWFLDSCALPERSARMPIEQIRPE